MAKQGRVMATGLLVIGMVMASGCGPTTDVAAVKQAAACGPDLTDSQKTQRAFDIAEIINVTSAHEYLHGALMHKEEIEQIWSKRDDITWTNNTDKYANRNSVWAFYVENLKNFPARGALWYHMLTTPYVEVAGDGQTAKAIFMSFGNVSGEMQPGMPMSQWTQEKYGIDLIKEDGRWKIWHLRTYVDFYVDTNKSWTDLKANIAAIDTKALEARNEDGSLKAGVQQEAGASFQMVKPDEKKVFYPGYSTDRMPQYNPEIPKPYCTWSEVEPY